MPRIKLSIVIVSFNKKNLLSNMLNSIRTHCKNFSCEVVVVDNASYDGSAQMVKDFFPEAKLISKDKNLGCCPAYNVGFEASEGEYACLMHEDVLIHENTMQKLCDFLDKNPRVGYVGPKNLDENGNILKTIERFHNPAYDIVFSYKVIFSKILNTLKLNFNNTKTIDEAPLKVDWMRLSCIMVRKAALKEVGLFDDDIIEWWDDPYVQLKMRRAGWDGYYIPTAEITHYKGLTRDRQRNYDKPTNIELLWIYSKYKYFKKFYGTAGLCLVKCNDIIIFAIYLLTYLFIYYFVSKNTDTRWEINRWIEYLEVIFCVRRQVPINL